MSAKLAWHFLLCLRLFDDAFLGLCTRDVTDQEATNLRDGGTRSTPTVEYQDEDMLPGNVGGSVIDGPTLHQGLMMAELPQVPEHASLGPRRSISCKSMGAPLQMNKMRGCRFAGTQLSMLMKSRELGQQRGHRSRYLFVQLDECIRGDGWSCRPLARSISGRAHS